MESEIGFLQQRTTDLHGGRQLSALNEIDANFDNIRAAWTQALKRKNYAAVDAMIEGVYRFTIMRGRFQEGGELFELARQQLAPASGEQPHRVWGRVLARYADIGSSDAASRVEQSLAIAEQQGDQPEIAFCLYTLGGLAAWGKDFTKAITLYDKSLAHYRQLNDQFGTAAVLLNIGGAYADQGQVDNMLRFTRQSLELQRAIGDRLGEAASLNILAEVELITGDLDAAENYGQQALAINREMGYRWGIGEGTSMLTIAFPALLKGKDVEEIRKLAQEALTIAKSYKHAWSIGRALMILGLIAAVEEDYTTAHQFGTEGQSTAPDDPYQLILGNMNLSYIECGLQDYAAAHEHLSAVLRFVSMFGFTEVMRRCIPVAAVLMHHKGSSERAVELLALAFAQPTSGAEAQSKLPLYISLRDKLQAELSPVDYTAAWQRGTALNLNTVVAALLAE